MALGFDVLLARRSARFSPLARPRARFSLLARPRARFDTWLLASMLLSLGYGCASGANGNTEARDPVVTDEDASEEEEPVEEDADVEPEEDADPAPAADAGMDAGPAKDSGSDAGATDTGALPDTGRADTGVMPDTGAGSPDAGPDASRPPPAALPMGKAVGNGWTYAEITGTRCRDGSTAGYYYRKGSERELLLLLGGSGACTDSFYCSLSPKNVRETFNPDSLVEALFPGLAVSIEIQAPSDDGILKRDSANPVGSWSMVFVPYCTGDVHAGAKPDGTVPGVSGMQQFVGYTNMGLFLKSLGPSFPDAQRVLLAGTGAGGFGALLNLERTSDFFAPQGAKTYVISDSGIPFQDPFLAACLQKRWRDLWNFEAVLPQCPGCRNADGGGLAKGLGTYLFKEKFKDRMMGGLVTSREDEIIRLFFSDGLNNCGGGDYTNGNFQMGLRDVINNVVGADRLAYYVLNGAGHMHLWRSRYYATNGLEKSIAAWVADVLADKPTHLGQL
jgi:hypothetical protein